MLKFKNQAEFDRWQASLAPRPKLRVAASLGQRVEIDEHEARVVLTAVPARRRWSLPPPRATVERVVERVVWTVVGLSAWGVSLCLAALWGAWKVGGL